MTTMRMTAAATFMSALVGGPAMGDGLAGEVAPRPSDRPGGLITVTVKGLPKDSSAKVLIERRSPDFDRAHKNGLTTTKRLVVGEAQHFRYETKAGRYVIVGRPVTLGGDEYKAHRMRVVVNRKHGVRVTLRYYHEDHKHFPVPGVNTPAPGSNTTPIPSTPQTPPSTPNPPVPAIDYPATTRGAATSLSQGAGVWKQCKITWSFDPGPTARLGGDVQTELKLLRGIFNSIQALSGYQFEEVQTNGEIRIQMVDHLAPINGIQPSGTSMPSPQDGSPFTQAVIQYDATGMLAPGSIARVDTRQNLYAHEIGHAFGLNHVNDPQQIMNPVVPNEKGWGSGDVAAFKAMPSTC